MPTITINKNVLEQLLGKKLPEEDLKDRISMLGTDLEKVENDVITVEIFPNRPDMLSEQGFARALSSFIGVKIGLPKYTVKKSGVTVIIDASVSMRPYTACAIVKNLTFTTERIRELMQVQEKLATTHGRNRKKSGYGIYPLQHISFPVTYCAKDPATVTFSPLGFDTAMSGTEILETHPKAKSYKHLTGGWKKYPFFIDAKKEILSMLPFTNSQTTGKVDEKTKDVFIECSGTDLENVQVALNILVTTLADMGGDIYSIEMKYPDKTLITPNLTPRPMEIDLNYVNKRIGLHLSEQGMKLLLEKMGYGFEQGKALVPAYRADILHPVDLVEDIAIAYGYENLKEEIPNVATIGEEDAFEKFARKIREMLVGLQLLEVKNYHLLTAEHLNEKMNLDEDLIALKNALGEHNHLRNSLLPSLLKNLAENQHNDYPQNIFELGRVFHYDTKKETGVKESEHLAVALCHDTADFTAIRQILDALFSSLGLSFSVQESSHPSFIPGRVAEIMLNKQKIGLLGEIHPQVLQNWTLVVPVVVLELDLENLFQKIKEEK